MAAAKGVRISVIWKNIRKEFPGRSWEILWLRARERERLVDNRHRHILFPLLCKNKLLIEGLALVWRAHKTVGGGCFAVEQKGREKEATSTHLTHSLSLPLLCNFFSLSLTRSRSLSLRSNWTLSCFPQNTESKVKSCLREVAHTRATVGDAHCHLGLYEFCEINAGW